MTTVPIDLGPIDLGPRHDRLGADAGGPVLLASSTGGHLTELTVLVERWGLSAVRQHWVVPRTPQSESLLAGRPVTWASPVGSRDLAGAMRNLGSAVRLQRRLRPSVVVSAGAAQAVPHLVAASVHRTPIVYVESVARRGAPSVTGRIASRLPGSRLYSQCESWGPGWARTEDVFSCFAVRPVAADRLTSVVVTLGTERFGFPRAVESVLRAVPPDVEVTWQAGTTTWWGPSGQLQRWLPADQLAARIQESSVVVSHGGAGSVLTALSAGHVPVVLPRLAARGEHVDDHQVPMCRMLADRGLVVLVEPEEALGIDHLLRAARMRAVPATAATPAGVAAALGVAS